MNCEDMAKRIRELEQLLSESELERQRLTTEIEFLRTHPAILQGLKGERLACALTSGIATSYAERYDIAMNDSIYIEVKYSKLNIPVKHAPTRRWNWSKPLGMFDKGKNFDFLILIGEKDTRFPEQYVDESPYVFFLVPRAAVENLITPGKTIGGMIQINSNLRTARAGKSVLIKNFLVPISDIEQLIADSETAA